MVARLFPPEKLSFLLLQTVVIAVALDVIINYDKKEIFRVMTIDELEESSTPTSSQPKGKVTANQIKNKGS